MVILLTLDDDPYFETVIEYCQSDQIPYKKVSLETCYISYVDLVEDNFCLTTNEGYNIIYNEIDFFLYRSGHLLNIDDFNTQRINNLSTIERAYLKMESDTLLDFIYSKINEKSFGHLSQKPLNKLKQLSIANKCGLTIPKTYITNNKRKVESVLGNSFITKAIQENVAYQDSMKILYQKVEQVRSSELSETFFPSLFQESVNKVLELRSFFFNKKFYTIAFTSDVGSIDMRDNYDFMDYYKYTLPKHIENKLQLFFTELNLFSGSVDLLINNNGDYVFLEVNTEGQFDWVSKLGGYNLNKVITDYLKQLK